MNHFALCTLLCLAAIQQTAWANSATATSISYGGQATSTAISTGGDANAGAVSTGGGTSSSTSFAGAGQTANCVAVAGAGENKNCVNIQVTPPSDLAGKQFILYNQQLGQSFCVNECELSNNCGTQEVAVAGQGNDVALLPCFSNDVLTWDGEMLKNEAGNCFAVRIGTLPNAPFMFDNNVYASNTCDSTSYVSWYFDGDQLKNRYNGLCLTVCGTAAEDCNTVGGFDASYRYNIYTAPCLPGVETQKWLTAAQA